MDHFLYDKVFVSISNAIQHIGTVKCSKVQATWTWNTL